MKVKNIINESTDTKAWMVRRDGKVIPVLTHIYGSYDGTYDETLAAAEWLYKNTANKETKDKVIQLIAAWALEETKFTEPTIAEQIYKEIDSKPYKFLSKPFIKSIAKKLEEVDIEDKSLDELDREVVNALDNEFMRVRAGGEVNSGIRMGDFYFRLSSKYFNWFNTIWQFVYDRKHLIKTVTVLQDEESTGKKKYYRHNGQVFDHMPVDEFISIEGSPYLGENITRNIKMRNSGLLESLRALNEADEEQQKEDTVTAAEDKEEQAEKGNEEAKGDNNGDNDNGNASKEESLEREEICEALRGIEFDGWKQIDKNKARKLWEKEEDLGFCPCNLNPRAFQNAFFVVFNKTDDEPDFDKFVNAYTFYNCGSRETGKYPSFFAKEESIKKLEEQCENETCEGSEYDSELLTEGISHLPSITGSVGEFVSAIKPVYEQISKISTGVAQKLQKNKNKDFDKLKTFAMKYAEKIRDIIRLSFKKFPETSNHLYHYIIDGVKGANDVDTLIELFNEIKQKVYSVVEFAKDNGDQAVNVISKYLGTRNKIDATMEDEYLVKAILRESFTEGTTKALTEGFKAIMPVKSGSTDFKTGFARLSEYVNKIRAAAIGKLQKLPNNDKGIGKSQDFCKKVSQKMREPVITSLQNFRKTKDFLVKKIDGIGNAESVKEIMSNITTVSTLVGKLARIASQNPPTLISAINDRTTDMVDKHQDMRDGRTREAVTEKQVDAYLYYQISGEEA